MVSNSASPGSDNQSVAAAFSYASAAPLLDKLPGVVYRRRVDANWTLEYASAGCVALTGYSPEALINNAEQPYINLVHPADRATVVSTLQAALSDGPDYALTYRIVTLSNETRWVRDTGWRTDASNSAAVLEGFVQDITVQHRRDVLIATLAEARTFLDTADVWTGIRAMLERLGQAADVSRVYLFENFRAPDGAIRTSQRYEWVAPGIRPLIEHVATQDSTYNNVGEWARMLRQGRPVYGTASDFSEPGQQLIFEEQDVLSLAFVPIFMGEQWWGFLGFDDCVTARQWMQVEIDTLVTVADMIGAALRRATIEQAMQNTARLFQQIIDNAPTPICVRNLEGRYTLANQAYAQRYNLPAPDIVGRRPIDLFSVQQTLAFRHYDEQALQADGPIEYEETVPLSDGSTRYYQQLRFPIFDAAGRITGVGSIAADITAYKEAERQLRESQTLLSGILNNAELLIFARDPEGRFIMVNPFYANLIGVPQAEMIGKTTAELLPTVTSTILRNNDQQVIETQQTHIFEEYFLDPSGHEYTMLAIKFPLFDNQGKLYAVGGISTDVTSLKRNEEALRRSQQFLRLVIDNIPLAIFWKDRAFRYLGANKVFATIAGFDDPDAMVGLDDENDVMPWHKQADLYRTDDREVMETNQPKLAIEEPLVRVDGKRRWLRTSKLPLHDSTGAVIGVLGVFDDITERKSLEEERVLLQQQMIEAQQAALRELSTPLLPVAQGVLIMPLIGTIDDERASEIMEVLLDGVASHRAHTVILDITGVQVVDTQVANSFIQAARAVQLLGAQVMLTGIQPQIAQTLVHLGVDLGMLTTRATLQDGVAAVLRHHTIIS
ncbi:MAG: PAS domain-containing protein [Chloroflexaceae bacterium]|nr:PAS domain-containing protein [Chloroflexaceae bacterium]